MSQNRWDRISKKFTDDDPGITSEEVKTFLEMNFTNGYHEKLCGTSASSPRLDPGLIMDLRHESVKNRKLRESSVKFKVQRELNMENIRNHNNLVESRMIANELTKYKMDIKKMSARSSAVSRKYEDSLEDSSDEDSEEAKLLRALRESEDATFAYKNESNDIVVEKKNRKVEIHEFSYEEGSGFSGSTATISEGSQEKAVHFEDDFIKISAQPKSAAQEEYQEYFEINEDYSKFNVDDDNDQPTAYDDCFLCCNDADCQFTSRSYDLQSFYSMPNLNDGDLESLMKITKFQSMMTVETTLKDCSCCSTFEEGAHSEEDRKIQLLDKSIEEAETEKMLIVRRMELEEKNYQELVIMSNAYSKNISEPHPFECEKIITGLFEENQAKAENLAERELMKSCFKDWLQKTTVSKILKTNAFTNEDRVKKINCFLNKIRLEQNKGAAQKAKKESSKIKAKQQTSSSSSSSKVLKKDYEHKLKVQSDIIELQKLKIQRQERLITEIKLAKFTEMLKESKNDLKMELINAKRGNTKLRAKARCIEMAANIRADPEEDEKRKLLAQGLIVPKFLQKMQERAIERLTRHEEARERRLRLENEKEEMKTAAEIARRLEDEDIKRKRHLEMREKRRLEKMAKILKEQERQWFQENLKKAREHYARNLMKNIGFKAFQLLIRLKRTNHKKSTIHRRKICMKKCFNLWFINTQIVWDNKRAQADRLHDITVLRASVKEWKRVHNIHKSKFLVAIDWYEVKVTEKLFKCWVNFARQSKFIESNKTRKAEAHYNCQIKWKLFDCWHRFPAIMKIERETEVRRQKWRMKVWDLLPDYRPQDTP